MDRVVAREVSGDMKLKGRILKPGTSGSGHLVIRPSKNGIPKTHYVHCLVTRAFIGPCPNGQEVRHGPKGVGDNSIDNLSYGTHSENVRDKERDGTWTAKAVRRGDGKEYKSITEAAKDNGIQLGNISNVCRKYITPDGYPHLTAGGHTWQFI